MKRAVDVAKEFENEYSTTFQEPVFGWLGTHDSAVSPLIGVCTLSVRVGDPRNPEVDKALISPLKLAYLASMIRHNLKVLLVRNYRGAFQVLDVDIYQEIANFAGSYPAPNIIINLEGEGITGILPRDHGGTGTDLSTTGGTSRILFQESTNSNITVRVLANADLPTTISGKTFTGDTVSDYLAFTEASTPSAPANTAGRLYARDVLGFTRFGYIDSNSLIVDISRDRTTEVNNATGITINALRVVRVNGASGSSPYQPTVTPAQANSVANVEGVLGVTIASINNSSNGRVMLHGRLENVDTSLLSVGAVYVDASTPGVLTGTKPTIGRRVGYVLRQNATTGVLLVDPGELINDAAVAVFAGATGGANGTTGLVPQPLLGQQDRILTADGNWKNTMDAVTIGSTTPAGAKVTTFETTGAVIFNEAGIDVDFRVEGDGDVNLLFVDASSDRVGIGTNTPTAKLNVAGEVIIDPNSATQFVVASGNINYRFANDGGTAPVFNFLASDGTVAAPAPIENNHVLGTISFQGRGTSNSLPGAEIYAQATQDYSTTAGGKVIIAVTANGGTGTTTAVTIDQDKSLTMNNAPVSVGTSYFKASAGSNAGNDRLWQSSTDKMPVFQTAQGMYIPLSGKFWALLNSITTTSASAVSITSGTTWGTLTVPANQPVAGTILSFRWWGTVVSTAGSLAIDISINGTGISFASLNRINSTTTPFAVEFIVVVRSASGSNNAVVSIIGHGVNGETTTASVTTFTLDCTIANAFTFSAAWVGAAGQSVTFNGGMATIH